MQAAQAGEARANREAHKRAVEEAARAGIKEKAPEVAERCGRKHNGVQIADAGYAVSSC